jgi:hypothetical protein
MIWKAAGGAALALCLLSGCQDAPKVTIDWLGGPFFAPTNFVGLTELPPEIRRVAVLPISGLEGLPPESTGALEEAARIALLGAGRFEVVPVEPAMVRSIVGKPAVSSVEVLPTALFDRIVRDQAADAVLLIDVTLFRPYTPMALGVRVKLASCSGTRPILWAFDTVFDVRNPAVANSARRYAAGGHPGLVDPGPSAMQSPSRFAAYVFTDTFAVLPQRPPPVPALPADSSNVPAKVSRPRAD